MKQRFTSSFALKRFDVKPMILYEEKGRVKRNKQRRRKEVPRPKLQFISEIRYLGSFLNRGGNENLRTAKNLKVGGNLSVTKTSLASFKGTKGK